MKRKSLNSEVSSFGRFIKVLLLIVFATAFFVGLSSQRYFLSFFVFILFIPLSISYFKSLRNKVIEYDEEFIYFDDKTISLKDVLEIGKGWIKYKSDKIEKIYFEYNYFEKNYSELARFHKTLSLNR